MKKFQYYFSKLGSRKFQILVIAVALCLLDKFPAPYVADVMMVYIGANIVQKIIHRRKHDEV
jgi:hypothetical protein